MDHARQNEKMIAGLHPLLQPLCREHLRLMAEAGHPCAIKEGMRTFEYQASLYAKGRTKPGARVTNAPAGRSNHNYGCAYDIVPVALLATKDWSPASPVWKIVQSKGRSIAGLSSLYARVGWDLPHFELDIALTRDTRECLAIFKRGGMPAVWAAVTRQFNVKFPMSRATQEQLKSRTASSEAALNDAPELTYKDVARHVRADAVKSVALKAGARVAAPSATLWGMGVTGRVLLICVGLVVLGVGGYMIYRYWPAIRYLFVRAVKEG